MTHPIIQICAIGPSDKYLLIMDKISKFDKEYMIRNKRKDIIIKNQNMNYIFKNKRKLCYHRRF